MKLTYRVDRKTEFLLALGLVGLLWGPGIFQSGSDPVVRPTRAEAAYIATLAEFSPCAVDVLPLPDTTPTYDRYAAFQVTVTGYSSTVAETDDTPGITAAGTPARAGIIALSQDMLREYTPGAPFSYHDRVEIPGLGQFRVEDTMHPRWTRRADVWFGSRQEALAWGVRSRRLFRLPDDPSRDLPLPGPVEVAASFGKANFQ
jgi:3D (Asp-Asp-Asp) domain-containing protein